MFLCYLAANTQHIRRAEEAFNTENQKGTLTFLFPKKIIKYH